MANEETSAGTDSLSGETFSDTATSLSPRQSYICLPGIQHPKLFRGLNPNIVDGMSIL